MSSIIDTFYIVMSRTQASILFLFSLSFAFSHNNFHHLSFNNHKTSYWLFYTPNQHNSMKKFNKTQCTFLVVVNFEKERLCNFYFTYLLLNAWRYRTFHIRMHMQNGNFAHFIFILFFIFVLIFVFIRVLFIVCRIIIITLLLILAFISFWS